MFKFEATVMQDQVLTIAFGSDPANTQSDLAVFTASGQGTLVDKWGTLTLASNDFQQNWKNVVITKDGSPSKYTFVGYRKPDTQDPFRKDTIMPCGGTQTYTWTVSPAAETGTWQLETDSDCNVIDPNATQEAPPPAEHASMLASAAAFTTAGALLLSGGLF